MDGNCNIITEILLVISYTTSYCPTLVITHCDALHVEQLKVWRAAEESLSVA